MSVFGALAGTVSEFTSSLTNGLTGSAIIGIVFGILFKKLGLLAAMGSYAGYPPNYQVCMEVITLLAQTPEEEEFLKEQVLQKVIIGGVAAVSRASVSIAGIMVSMAVI